MGIVRGDGVNFMLSQPEAGGLCANNQIKPPWMKTLPFDIAASVKSNKGIAACILPFCLCKRTYVNFDNKVSQQWHQISVKLYYKPCFIYSWYNISHCQKRWKDGWKGMPFYLQLCWRAAPSTLSPHTVTFLHRCNRFQKIKMFTAKINIRYFLPPAKHQQKLWKADNWQKIQRHEPW